MDFSGILQTMGTFLPTAGMLVTFLAAFKLPDSRRRWIALIAGPALTAVLCTLLGGAIAFDGNMLFVLQFVLLLIALPVYYLVLVLIWLFARRRAGSV